MIETVITLLVLFAIQAPLFLLAGLVARYLGLLPTDHEAAQQERDVNDDDLLYLAEELGWRQSRGVLRDGLLRSVWISPKGGCTDDPRQYFLTGDGMLAVIEAMGPPYEFNINDQRGHQNSPDWHVDVETYSPDHRFYHGNGRTVPEAVCKAAVAALRESTVSGRNGNG